MKVDIEEISAVKRQLKVVVPEESVQKELTEVYSKLKREVTIKGFRKGKTPRSVLDRYYKDRIEFEVLNKLINESYQKAIKEHALKPISNPILKEKGELKEGQELHYTAIIEVKPVFEVKDYLGLEFEKKEASVTDEDVDKKLDELKGMYATLREVDEERALKDGDFALLDYEGTINEKPFKGGKKKDQIIEIKQTSEEGDLSSQLLGMKRGEEREVEISFPTDDPNSEMADKRARFQVTLKGIKEKIVPDLNDEFARDIGQFKSLKALKKKIREDLLEEKKKEAEIQLQKDICRKIAENNPIEIPEALVEAQIQASLANTKYRLAQQGVQIESLDLNDTKIKEDLRESAQRAVHESLILEAIAEAEGIEVDEKDLQGTIEEMARQTGKNAEEIKRTYQNEDAVERLRLRIKEEKTLDFLIQRAMIKERAGKKKKK